jgi:hypothetical protein
MPVRKIMLLVAIAAALVAAVARRADPRPFDLAKTKKPRRCRGFDV